MPRVSYLPVILSIVAGLWLVWVIVPKIDRRRNRRRIDRGIAKYLRETAGKKSSEVD
jgi:hypothetical protein